MKHENLLKLYLKFLGGTLDFYGIKLIPSLSDDSRTINWRLENPNDISFNRNVIKHFIYDSYQHFISITVGYSDKSWAGFIRYFAPHLKLSDIPEYYLSQETKESLEVASKNIKEITYNISSKKLTFDINIFKYWISFRYEEEILIESKIDVLGVRDESGKKYANEFISFFISELERSANIVEFVDVVLGELADVIWNSPTLCDKDTNFINTNAGFYDLDGKALN
jgi:hypothetical protein